MKRHCDGLTVQTDTPTSFEVITPSIGPNKKPIWFGAVYAKKSAVTYHLFSLYFNPALEAAVPPELLKRKQGKTCFNFQRPDSDLFAQLDKLTAMGRSNFERHGLLKAGPVTREQFEAMYQAAGGDTEALARRRKKMVRDAAKKRAATIARKQSASTSRAKKTKG
ncbi:MAG TPA: hypothetical protein VKB78_00990 [Pirellulales bacterium]|nr:hypothetical protein [Pirellulales bacterium]